MKKIFLLFVFLSLAFSYSYGQTYYYKAVVNIDANGVKSKIDGSGGMWVTFINDKGICYESDENGYKRTNTYPMTSNYYYRKTQNGTHVYEDKKTTMQYTPGNMFSPLGSTQMIEVWAGNCYYFSSNFSEMQQPPRTMHGMTFYGFEYIRTDGPEKKIGDDIPIF
ncbi:MAG: hypothetical protein LBK45_03465 [Tannerellaceae bacterium]|jgi:hypothetical protein|nr:hypothetical protein [Tannerellaceae bacterium]